MSYIVYSGRPLWKKIYATVIRDVWTKLNEAAAEVNGEPRFWLWVKFVEEAFGGKAKFHSRNWCYEQRPGMVMSSNGTYYVTEGEDKASTSFEFESEEAAVAIYLEACASGKEFEFD